MLRAYARRALHVDRDAKPTRSRSTILTALGKGDSEDETAGCPESNPSPRLSELAFAFAFGCADPQRCRCSRLRGRRTFNVER